MNFRQAFEILEIEPIRDQKVIKRAYAKLVRQYHPEEYPEEWQRIHEAYECAMNYAQNKLSVRELSSVNVDETENSVEKKISQWEIPADSELALRGESVSDESNYDFPDLVEIVRQENKKRRSEQESILVNALNRISELGVEHKQKASQWKHVLGLQEVQMTRTNPIFLRCLGDCLSKSKMGYSCYKVVKNFLEEVHQEMNDSRLNDGFTRANFEAWEVASKGLEQAVWWSVFSNTRRTLGTSKAKFYIRIALFVLFVVIKGGTSLLKIVHRMDKLADRQVVLQLDRGDTGSLFFGKKSTFPTQKDAKGWRLRYAFPNEEYLEPMGIKSEGTVAACFLIGNTERQDETVKLCLSLDDFGLDEGAYEVWQCMDGNYCNMPINTLETSEEVYPYEKDGLLFLKANVYIVNGEMPSKFMDSQPIIIMRIDSAE